MKRIFSRIPGKLTAISLCLLLISGGCTAAKGEGFAIYLTRDNIPPAQMWDLSSVKLADQPIISTKDIISYYSQTHAMKLTDSAIERISHLQVPTSGKSFVVCVDKKPVYWGAFWTLISSQSFDGVTILTPNIVMKEGMVALDLGYPAPSFYNGQDPRNNPEILKSLEESGKLVTE